MFPIAMANKETKMSSQSNVICKISCVGQQQHKNTKTPPYKCFFYSTILFLLVSNSSSKQGDKNELSKQCYLQNFLCWPTTTLKHLHTIVSFIQLFCFSLFPMAVANKETKMSCQSNVICRISCVGQQQH
jgi:hypothetical protein